jgi:hypothetical protein
VGSSEETGTGPSKGAVRNVEEDEVLSGIERKQRIENVIKSRRNPETIREVRELRRARTTKPLTAEEARAVAAQVGVSVATDRTGKFTVEQAPKRRTAATLRGNDPAKGKRESGQATAKTADEARKSLATTEPTTDVPVRASALAGVQAAPEAEGRIHTVQSLRVALRDPKALLAHTSGIQRILMTHIVEQARRLGGDVEVHTLDPKSLREAYEDSVREHGGTLYDNVNAFYDYHTDTIYVRSDRAADPKTFARDLLHEATHAIYDQALLVNLGVKADIRRLMAAVSAQYDAEQKRAGKVQWAPLYALENEHEFVTEAWSNQSFQDLLSRTQVPQKVHPTLGPTMSSAWRQLLASVRTVLFKRQLFTGKWSQPGHTTALEEIIRATHDVEQSMRTVSQLAEVRASMGGDVATQARGQASDIATTARAVLRKIGIRGATTQELSVVYDRLFNANPIDRLMRANDAMHATREEAIEKARPHLEWLVALERANPREADAVAQLANHVTQSNINVIDKGDATLQEMLDANPHLGGLKSDRATDYQARAALMPAQEQFMALSPDTRRGFLAAAKFFSDSQNRNTKAVVGKLLAATNADLTINQLADLQERTMKGKLTEDDKTIIGDDSLFNALVGAQEFRRTEGTYFPQLRYGNHVVLTRDNPGDLHGGTFDPNTSIVEFIAPSGKDKDARAMFARYAREQAARGVKGIKVQAVAKRRYLKSTGEVISEANARGQDHIVAYRARVQTRGLYMFDSHKEAARFIRENGDQFDSISREPEMREEIYKRGELTSAAVQGIVKAVNARQDINSTQKAILSSILQEASARQLTGNRMQQRALPRRNVRGASEDLKRNMNTYAQASANAYARTRHMDELRAVHSEMQEHAESHRFDADAAARTEVIDEIYKRLLEPTVSKTGQSEAVRMALTLSFMYRLGSPAYSVINGMQPAMVTVPVLGGRHGFLRTMAAYSRAYKDIGVHEVLWRGTAESGRAAGQIMSPTFDTRDPLQTVLDRVAKAPDAVFLGKVLNEGISRKKIGNNAGMEIGQLAGSGQGRGKQAIAGLDRMFRQMPAAIEDINRSATMIMAARLGKADGMTEAQAIDYAFKTMMETQGDYSAANNPRFMSQKWYSPAFQFKKFAIMEANLLGDMVRRAFHGASPEEKRVAWKQIGGTLMVQMVMAGAVGLPASSYSRPASWWRACSA